MASIWLPNATRDVMPVWPETCSTPMRFVVDSGLRPIVEATVDGVEVSMLLHANAGFVAMLTHDALARVTGRRVSKESEFGLGHDLRPSSAGRGHTEVDDLTVAGRSMSAVRLEIFDLPTTNWEGMLGVDWLVAAHAVVDFGRSLLVLPGPGAGPVSGGGGRRIDMDRDDSTGRFTCWLGVEPARGENGRFVVSTVAETTFDVEYARTLGIDLGDPVDEEHGPTGVVLPVYRPPEPLTLFGAGAPLAAVRPAVYDIYAYGDNPRPTATPALAGYLGADLLLETRAAVDFGD